MVNLRLKLLFTFLKQNFLKHCGSVCLEISFNAPLKRKFNPSQINLPPVLLIKCS